MEQKVSPKVAKNGSARGRGRGGKNGRGTYCFFVCLFSVPVSLYLCFEGGKANNAAAAAQDEKAAVAEEVEDDDADPIDVIDEKLSLIT